MTTILRLDASVTGAASVTTGLNALAVETLNPNGDATVVHRDLTQLPLPTAASWGAAGTPDADRTADQAESASLADALIAELEAADTVIIAAPLYNFGVPSAVKAWMDYVARAGRTFAYTEQGPQGLLTGKRAIIVTASGGVPIGSEGDFATPHLSHFLGFLGFTDITLIEAGGLLFDQTKLGQAQDRVRALAS